LPADSAGKKKPFHSAPPLPCVITNTSDLGKLVARLFSNSLIKASVQFKSTQFSFEDLEEPEVYQVTIQKIRAVLTSYKKQVILLLPVILSFLVLAVVFEKFFWIAATAFPILRLFQIAVLVAKVDDILIQAKLLKARSEYKYDLERWSNAYIPYTSDAQEYEDYVAKNAIMDQWHRTKINPYKHPFEIET
jgi:hypothetical protein